jgi:23S rRNA pseudouridine2604 synthase
LKKLCITSSTIILYHILYTVASRLTRFTKEFQMAEARTPARAADNPAGIRVSRLLSEQGLCSRREADRYIEKGWVFVDGKQVTELGARALPGAKVTLAAKASQAQARLATILLNKPVGFVSGQPEPGYEPAVVLIRRENQYRQPGDPEFDPHALKGLAPAGRLDIDSTGLLVLTQDGRVARRLIGEDSGVEKEYLVRVEGNLPPDGLELLRHGLFLDDKQIGRAHV